MVVKMMKWRPWPPYCAKKFQVSLTLHSLEDFPGFFPDKGGEEQRVLVDVKWKGPKGPLGSRFKRSLQRGRTTDKLLGSGSVTWDEEFKHECLLSMARNSGFQPWNIHFIVLQAVQQGSKTALSIGGTAVINLADFAPPAENASQLLRVRVSCSVGGEVEAALVVTVNFVELQMDHDAFDPLLRIVVPSLPCIGGAFPQEKDGQLVRVTHKAKAKNSKNRASAIKEKVSGNVDQSNSGKLSPTSSERSQDSADFDSDSAQNYDFRQVAGEGDYHSRNSFSYGTLAGVNLFVEGALPFYGDCRENIYTAGPCISIHRTHAESIPKMADEVFTSDSDQASSPPKMRSLLSWKKRKLNFRSPQAKGEPLLNKSYGEDGGDDIDFDRRQSDSPALILQEERKDECPLSLASGYVDFGDEHFSVGSWETRELTSRDGQMRLSTKAFFASIDQRSEQVAGESACTALVAVIANWLHQNPNRMPIRAEFDTLIREGSAEWRKLCDVEPYRDRFPDRHFDLDTVLQAEVRPLMVVPERSFVGFFQTEGLGASCEFLQGAMSFESIWDAIWEEIVNVKPEDSFEHGVYIVSWNDHFFVLKVDHEAYYIIDTLGERLFEGCNQAYILRFDKYTNLARSSATQTTEEEKRTSPQRVPAKSASSLPGSASRQGSFSNPVDDKSHILVEREEKTEDKPNIDLLKLEIAEKKAVYRGKEACKQFIKGFFAALPLRELESDIKKGRMDRIPLHKRLQIEFHFTMLETNKESFPVQRC